MSIKRITFLLTIALIGATGFLYEYVAPSQLSSTIYGNDSGDYLAAVLTGGIPHPTGYPLYLLLSDLAQRFFSGNYIWRQVQVSIIPATICVAGLFGFVLLLLRKEENLRLLTAGLIACASLAVAPLFWSQAVTIEVYALNAMFIALALLWIELVLSIDESTNRLKLLLIISLAWVCGLGLGNHRTYLLIYPLVGFCIYTLFRNKHAKKAAILSTIGWLSGIVTYLLLPVRAAAHPAVNWGDASTLQGFLWLVSGGDYHKLLFAIGLDEYPARFFAFNRLLLEQFGYIGCLTGLLGLFSEKVNRLTKWMLGYVFCAYTLFALGYKSNDSMVYLLPAIFVFAIWIGMGIIAAWDLKWNGIRVGLVLPVLITLQLGLVLPNRIQSFSEHSGDLGHYAETTLTNAAQGEYIFPETDSEVFSLWYYQYGLHWRPDVVIISRGLLSYPWYRENLSRIYPDVDFAKIALQEK